MAEIKIANEIVDNNRKLDVELIIEHVLFFLIIYPLKYKKGWFYMRVALLYMSLLFIIDCGYKVAAENSATSFATWLESATIKVRQDAQVVKVKSFTIKAARNEFEPFQLVMRSNDTLKSIDVEITDFIGDSGKISKEYITIFRVDYLNIINKSCADGQLGEWPDILYPKIDAYFKEKRNSFPFDLKPKRIQPIWFDVFVPRSTKAGFYKALVKTTAGGKEMSIDTIKLKVWNFTLPATASLKSRFGLNSSSIHYGHYGDVYKLPSSMNYIVDLQRLYTRANLRHRLTSTPININFYKWNGTDNYSEVDDRYFQRSIKNFVGDGDPQVEYGNSMFTSLFFDFSPIYQAYKNCDKSNTTPSKEMLAEVKKRSEIIAGMFSEKVRSEIYILCIDEPGGGEIGCGIANPTLDYSSAIEMAKIIKAAGLKTRITKAKIPELLNTTVSPARNDYFDMWIATYNRISGRSSQDSKSLVETRSEYNDPQNNAKVWWYQSCMTHGCGIEGGEVYNGYPQYMVEFQGIRNRIFPWLSFKYDIEGELYWGMDANYYLGAEGNNTGDPWFTLWNRYKGNGEGTLFYPGVANTKNSGLPCTTITAGKQLVRGAHTRSIGGIHDIPIESIRLKMIREGYEDYEYMYKLVQLGDSAYAKKLVNSIVSNTFTYSQDPAAYEAVRESLAKRILELPGGPDSPTATTYNRGTSTASPSIKTAKQGIIVDWNSQLGKMVKCEIYDAKGSLLVKQQVTLSNGRNYIRWADLFKMRSTGFYIVKITSRKSQTHKFLYNLAGL